MMPNIKNKKGCICRPAGFSLIEILVVLGIFALLATLATQSVVLTLRSAKKAESSVKVKENLSYALGVMERQLRNATFVDTDSCGTRVDYTDSLIPSTNSSFQCVVSGTNYYVASGSARLTSSEIKVSPCTITCNATSVTISLTGTSATATGIENTTETVSTTVFLRQGN